MLNNSILYIDYKKIDKQMDNKHLKGFNEHVGDISDDMYKELREELYILIADNFGNHADDYPHIETTTDDALEIVKSFINKLK